MSDQIVHQSSTDLDPVIEVRIDVLTRIGQAIEAAATLDELLLLSLYELTQYFGMAWGAVGLLDDTNSLQIVGEYPPQIVRLSSIPLDDLPAMRRVLRQRETVIVSVNLENDPSPFDDFIRARDIQTILLVPLIAQDTAMGVLGLGAASTPHNFTQSESALARVLTSQIATAIASLRLHEAARRRTQELATLNEIAAAITSTLDTREVYRLVVQKLSVYFQVEAGSLLLITEPTGDLIFVMTLEGGEERLAGVRVPAGQGIVGDVIRTRQWAIVHDVATDPRFYRKVSDDLGFINRSILCVPMIAKGRVIGAIQLLNKYDGNFEDDEAERLTRMAAFIGVAIENARLFQQVADGRDRLAAILDSTADGILMTDMHSTILTANAMAARIVGVAEQDLIGRSLDDVLEGLRTSAQEVVQRQWGNGAGGPDEPPIVVTEFSFAKGPHRYSRLLRLPVHDDHGNIYGHLAVLRDITQEKELEKLRDDYTSMLVHDLRAPLTSIMNGIMMVQRLLIGPLNDQQQELLKIAYQGSTTMLALINNLLDISKMEQGSMSLDRKPLIPYAIIDRALERLQASANSSFIKVEQRLAAHLPPLEADDEKIVRVLQNLLDNAIKFSPSGQVVTLGVDLVTSTHPLSAQVPIRNPFPPGDWMVFWVQDVGKGVPSAYHRRIFEKFGQIRGQKVRGTGLGLAFCKLTVEAHGGQIWVESEEGHGSVFVFILPLAG
ncbi:MAG: GAF domain-containing protein [Roseiflexaceae bacterium]|nr:GAF domain-containing protein [Roseiflexaceae bacterium]